MAERVVGQPEVSPPEVSVRDGRAWLGLGGVLGAFAIFVGLYFVPAIIGPDDHGYFGQGSLIARTGRTSFTPTSDVQFIGFHWLVTPSGEYFARYPPGMPLVIAAVQVLFGHRAAALVVPAMALLALLGTFSLARRLTTPWWGVVVAAMLAVNPRFLEHALLGDSHVFTTAALVWGSVFLVRWHETGRTRDAFFGGLLLGCIPTIRYPDAVVAVGVVAFFLASYRRLPQVHRHFGAAVLGAAIPVVLLLIRNQLAFGAFWRTAYEFTGEQRGFGWEYFKNHYALYLMNLSGDGLRSGFVLGLVGSVLMLGERRARAPALLILVATTAMLLLYMAYYWTGGVVGTMRFMLPTFPLYLAAAAWLLWAATNQAPVAVRAAAAAVLIVLQVGVSGAASLELAERQRAHKRILASVTEALEGATRPGDLVVAQGDLLPHLDFVGRWRLADEALLLQRGAGPIGLQGRFSPARDGAPAPEQTVKTRLEDEKLGVSAAERRTNFLASLRRWAGGEKVYLVAPERVLPFGVASTSPPESLRVLARVPTLRPAGLLQLDARDGLPGPAPDAGAPPPLTPPPAEARKSAGSEDDLLIVEWAP